MDAWKSFIEKTRWMIRKEFLATISDPRTRLVLLMPVLVQTMLFGYTATYDLDLAPYVVLDMSHSAAASDFETDIDGSPAFRRVRTLSNSNEIAEAIDSGEAMLAISIPSDFETKLNRGEASPIQVITDGRNTMTATTASNYVERIVAAYNAERNPKAMAVSLETIAWYNPNLITRWTFLPSLIAMLAFNQVLILSGLSVAREREQGTFDQLLVTPISPTIILIGKAAVPVLMGMIQSTLVLLICRFWFQVPMAGNLLTLWTVLFVFTLSCTGIGLSISAISSTMQQVMVYCFLLLMPMILLSGTATPVANMPEILQILTYADPLRFALDSVWRVYLEGCGLSAIAWNFVPMLAVASVTFPLAGWLFRHNLG